MKLQNTKEKRRHLKKKLDTKVLPRFQHLAKKQQHIFNIVIENNITQSSGFNLTKECKLTKSQY